MLRLRVFTPLPLVLASAFCLAQKKDIIIWGVEVDANTKGIEAAVREFGARHPEYNPRLLSIGAGRMNPQKLMTSIVGDVAPDVINQDRFTISDWASRGAFTALDDYIKRDGGQPNTPNAVDYYPSTWEEASYGGKIYGIPGGTDDRVLYWNRGMFRENADKLRAVGMDPERAPRTWTELIAYSKALTVLNPDGTLKRAGFIPNFGNAWLYIYAFMNNATFMTPDGRRCIEGEDKPMEEALKFVVDGYDAIGGYDKVNQLQSGFLAKANEAFLSGRVAMKIDGNWFLNDISRYTPHMDFGCAPGPVPDDRYDGTGRFSSEKDKFITWSGGFAYAIPQGARNPEGAWEFIKFITSVEGRLIQLRAQRDWERHLGRTYMPPLQAHKGANELSFKEFKLPDPKFAEAMRVQIDLLNHGRMRPVTFVGQLLWNENQKALDDATMHKLSPHDALARAQEAVQVELDAFYNRERHPVVDLSIFVKIGITICVLALVAVALMLRRYKLGKIAKAEARWAYIFISPWLIGFIVFTVGPMIASLFFSFTQYNVLTEARWVGFDNYAAMGTTDKANVLKAFSNAFYLAGIGVPFGILTGLAIAMLLNTKVRGLRIYRTLFYMPAIVPMVPSAILWTWVLSSDPNKGLLNGAWLATITKWIALPPPGWLQSEAWAKPALIMMGLWGAGSGMILWLAGLKGVPNSLYESASIDGANPRQQFAFVTLPQLSPIIFFNVVMGFITALQEFDKVYIMKPSDETVGPGDSLLLPVYHLFSNGFEFFRMGYACALAWLIFAIIIALTLIQFRLAPRWVHYEGER